MLLETTSTNMIAAVYVATFFLPPKFSANQLAEEVLCLLFFDGKFETKGLINRSIPSQDDTENNITNYILIFIYFI